MRKTKTITEYKEEEFLQLINEIMDAKGTDQYQDELLEHFIEVTAHPDGSDLIYYPEVEENATPENIVRIVKEWRASEGLPGFKGS